MSPADKCMVLGITAALVSVGLSVSSIGYPVRRWRSVTNSILLVAAVILYVSAVVLS